MDPCSMVHVRPEPTIAVGYRTGCAVTVHVRLQRLLCQLRAFWLDYRLFSSSSLSGRGIPVVGGSPFFPLQYR